MMNVSRKSGQVWRPVLRHIAPVGADFDVDDERDIEGEDVFHGLFDEGAEGVEGGCRDFEEEFVVDLENHAGSGEC